MGTGQDTVGPSVLLLPAMDTTVDSVGVLLVVVDVRDPSGVKRIEFQLLPASFSFPVQTPLDTASTILFPVPLHLFKHSSFRFYVRALDALDYETVTDSVTVTVR